MVAVLGVLVFGSVRENAPQAEADVTGTPHMYLDVTAPLCDNAADAHPSSTAVLVGSTYQVGICLQDQAAAPTVWEATVNYNNAITSGTEIPDSGAELDDNPDANDGDAPGGDKLGSNWDCTGLGFSDTEIENGSSQSHIVCNGTPIGSEDADLTDSPGLLATITYQADAVGNNVMSFTADGTSGDGGTASGVGNCDGTNCFGATVQQLPAADIQVTKSVSPNPVAAGSNATFTITVTNAGPSPATNVNVFDDLEDTWTAVSATINGGPDELGGQCTVGDPAPGFFNVAQCNLGTMNPGDVNVIAVTVAVPLDAAGKLFVNSALAGSGTLPGVIDETPDPDFTPTAFIANNVLMISPATACASDRYNGTPFDNPPGTFQDILAGDECDNVALAAYQVLPALVSITKDGAPDVIGQGSNVTWTVDVQNANGGSPASDIILTDTVDANQTLVSATVSAGTCAETGTSAAGIAGQTATCTSDQVVAPGGSIQLVVVSTIINSPSNITCVNDASVTFADPITLNANDSVTCLPPDVSMYKDKHPETPTRENVVNLWICEPGYNGTFTNTLPDWVGSFTAGTAPCDENGEGRLLLGEVLTNIFDPEGLGAFEFQIKFDHKIFDINVTETGFLYSTGRVPGVAGGCSNSIINENAILFGCVSKNPNPPTIVNGPTGQGTVAVVEVTPESDMKFRLHPGQENGVVRKILDENCEAADIFGDPLADANGSPLPGIVTGGLIEDCDDASVTVRILEGDLDLDCDVDVADDQAIAFRYGAFFGSLRYDPWFDMEPALKDFDIDIKDLQKVFGRNGSECSQSGMPADGTIPAQPPVEALSNGPL